MKGCGAWTQTLRLRALCLARMAVTLVAARSRTFYERLRARAFRALRARG